MRTTPKFLGFNDDTWGCAESGALVRLLSCDSTGYYISQDFETAAPSWAEDLIRLVGDGYVKYTWVDTFRTAIISPSDEARHVLQQLKTLGLVA